MHRIESSNWAAALSKRTVLTSFWSILCIILRGSVLEAWSVANLVATIRLVCMNINERKINGEPCDQCRWPERAVERHALHAAKYRSSADHVIFCQHVTACMAGWWVMDCGRSLSCSACLAWMALGLHFQSSRLEICSHLQLFLDCITSSATYCNKRLMQGA